MPHNQILSIWLLKYSVMPLTTSQTDSVFGYFKDFLDWVCIPVIYHQMAVEDFGHERGQLQTFGAFGMLVRPP